MLRRVFLAVAILGGILLATEEPSPIDVLPLPASTQSVRMGLHIRADGDYDLLVSVPKVGNELALTSETVPCDLAISISHEDKPILSQVIASIVRHSEIGYQNTQQYAAERSFHLKSGTYDVTISGGQQCAVATARGASVTLEKQEREHILGSLLYTFAARGLLVVGVLGLIAMEFRRGPKSRRQAFGEQRKGVDD